MISGKEALIALANGGDVLYINTYYKEKPTRHWGDAKECTVEQFFNGEWLFKIKPRTITLNGVEVPAPFKPKEGEKYWYIDDNQTDGFNSSIWQNHNIEDSVFIGKWRSKEEIKQVVAALRSIFKPQ